MSKWIKTKTGKRVISAKIVNDSLSNHIFQFNIVLDETEGEKTKDIVDIINNSSEPVSVGSYMVGKIYVKVGSQSEEDAKNLLKRILDNVIKFD